MSRGVNFKQACGELGSFIHLTVMHWKSDECGIPRQNPRGSTDGIVRQREIVAKLPNRAMIEWREEARPIEPNGNEWFPMCEVVIRSRIALSQEKELCESLGDSAPEASASKLHFGIWESASSLWQSGHYREAVEVAIKKLNAETQNKLGRRDVSEKALFAQAFGEQDPELGKPRLHRMENDGSSTFKSVQRGARFFAEGVFAGIRNPLAHESEQDMPEQQALEYLAALSVLARWVDESIVAKAES